MKWIAPFTIAALLVIAPLATADDVDIRDGLSHTIGDNAYNNDNVWLDYYGANYPGTHIDLISGGIIENLYVYKYGTLTISGGEVRNYLEVHNYGQLTFTSGLVNNDIKLYDDAIASIAGGTVADNVYTRSNSQLTISTGSVIGDSVNAKDYSSVTISGGTITTSLNVSEYGMIYLEGTGFMFAGNALSVGAVLSDYATYGTLTGTLADGTTLHCAVDISDSGEVAIIPEPVSIALLGLGSLILRRRKAA